MFRSEAAESFSTGVFDSEADYCNRIADLLERKVSKTLTLHLGETVRRAVEVAAAEWSEHLQTSLDRMERQIIAQLKTKLNQSASVETASESSREEGPVSIVREEQDDHRFGSPNTFTSDSEHSSKKSSPNWCESKSRSRQSPFHSQRTVEGIASLEQRLAHGIFTARLGKCRDQPKDDALPGSSDRSLERGPITALGKSVAFTSSISPSAEFGVADRSPSLQAIASETPKKFEMPCVGSASYRSITSLQPMATLQANQWRLATKRLHPADIIAADRLQSTPTRIFVTSLPRLLGVLPWNPRYRYTSMIYQAGVACVSIWATITIPMGFSEIVDDNSEQILCTCLRVVLAVGGLLGLGACLLFNTRIVFTNSLLGSYASRTDASNVWDKRSFNDTCVVLVVFATCIGLEYHYSWTQSRIETNCATIFVELLLLALCAQILRLIRCLCILTDFYCNYVSECTDFEDAVEEWYLLYATCRSVCASIQLCFVVLQCVSIGALLFALVSSDIRMIPEKLLSPRMIPGVLCASGVAYLSICASSFTHKCERVPMLINSLSLGDMDAKRMYLVEYIATSRTGFYLFNLQLSSGLVLKTFYIACAAAFSLTSKALVAKP